MNCAVPGQMGQKQSVFVATAIYAATPIVYDKFTP